MAEAIETVTDEEKIDEMTIWRRDSSLTIPIVSGGGNKMCIHVCENEGLAFYIKYLR